MEDEQPEEQQPEEQQPEEQQQPAEEQPAEAADPTLPVANELTYTGEAQALVRAEGTFLYSLDGETYASDIPTAINSGEYTVYFVPADTPDAQPQSLSVTIAKAEAEYTPPVAARPAE